MVSLLLYADFTTQLPVMNSVVRHIWPEFPLDDYMVSDNEIRDDLMKNHPTLRNDVNAWIVTIHVCKTATHTIAVVVKAESTEQRGQRVVGSGVENQTEILNNQDIHEPKATTGNIDHPNPEGTPINVETPKTAGDDHNVDDGREGGSDDQDDPLQGEGTPTSVNAGTPPLSDDENQGKATEGDKDENGSDGLEAFEEAFGNDNFEE